MRYSKEHKLETHARIVKKASARLREKGAHGIGVADLMRDAGLTHGGFYSHFDSREALVIEAFSYAIDRALDHWRKIAEEKPPAERLETVVNKYLTAAHRDAPGQGCAVASLGADMTRESQKTRKAFAAKLEEIIATMSRNFPDSGPKAARRQAMAAYSTMVGSLLLSRIAGTGELANDILRAGREAALAGSPAADAKAARKPRGVSTST